MDAIFQPALDCLARGDADAFDRLLADRPELATARSSCSHPTLLQCLVLEMPPPSELERLIEALVDRGADPSAPLIAAAGIGNVRAIAKLLDRGARIQGDGRWSPLEEALYWVQAAAASLLTERGASPSNLRAAAGLNDLDRMRACFDEHGQPNASAGEVAWPFAAMTIPDEVRRDPRQIIDNALIYAAAWGHRAAVDLLLDRGARLNAIPAGFDFAGTALHYAAHNGREELAEHLIELGADPSIKDTKIGVFPEDWAAHAMHEELAARLRQARFRHSDLESIH